MILAGLILGFSVIYLILKKKIASSLDPNTQIERIREEINHLIVDLNQTTDRNIALIEDRVNRLMDLLAEADKKINLLQRESEKHQLSNKVYADIARKKADTAKEDRQDEVLRLHREGFSTEMIAKRVGAPVSEVELIISLSGRVLRQGS